RSQAAKAKPPGHSSLPPSSIRKGPPEATARGRPSRGKTVGPVPGVTSGPTPASATTSRTDPCGRRIALIMARRVARGPRAGLSVLSPTRFAGNPDAGSGLAPSAIPRARLIVVEEGSTGDGGEKSGDPHHYYSGHVRGNGRGPLRGRRLRARRRAVRSGAPDRGQCSGPRPG